ncbi:MAG: hypothetical protein UE295_00475 [Acutalibacteraceae bacterium]|nr:hypothetical protein [Acutalibacteraceae bacterium]
MRVRAIDENNDWTFGRGLQDYKIDDRAVAQNVKTRLQSFYNDCFFDLEAGIDWFNLLSRGTESLLLLAIKQNIINTDGVVGLNNVDVLFDRYERHITIKYDIQTVYSRSYIDQFEI